MESSSSEAETPSCTGLSVRWEQSVPGGHGPGAEPGIPLDFQGFQTVFDHWRAKRIGDEEVRQKYGDTTLELLQAQLWGVRDGEPLRETQNAEGLAETLLDVIVEEASVEVPMEGGNGVEASGEQKGREGTGKVKELLIQVQTVMLLVTCLVLTMVGRVVEKSVRWLLGMEEQRRLKGRRLVFGG